MSATRTYADVTDGGLRFTNIRASEVGTGRFDLATADASFAPVASPLPFDGLVWRSFVAGVLGTGTAAPSSLTINIAYNVSAISPTALVASIRSNQITPDTVLPAGAAVTLTQEVRDLAGALLARSTLSKVGTTTDVIDPPIEAGDNLDWTGGFGTVQVSIAISFTMPANTPTSTAFEFSVMQQLFDTAPAAALGDLVWEDSNANGIRDAGEAGIAGATVQLLNAGGSVVGTTTTDANGLYGFTQLVPATYSVRFVTPAGGFEASPANQGADDAADSDAVGGISQQVTLSGGQTDLTLDAGFFRRASLGDFVFLDANGNGIQDAGDGALGGVRVELFDSAGALVGFTTTDAAGAYNFSGLRPGDYRVKFVAPEGYLFTALRQGTNAALDSDAGPGGFSQLVNLVSGEHDGTLDAGLVRLVPSIAINKLTNGIDGAELLRGGAVTWTYAVTNTGPVALAAVTLTDDREGAVTAFTGDVGNDGVLSVGEVWTFRKSGIATEAAYRNTGTVQATFTDGLGRTTDVRASDPSSYTTVVPSISIDKLTNGVDGAVLLAGSAVTWTYAVTNTGAIALRGVTVTDDREGAITAFTGDVGNDGVLSVGEVWTFSKSGIASLASYTNTGTVSATARDGFGNTAIVGDSDGSSYRTISPAIEVTKLTNGSDAPVLLQGSAVTWTYSVSNAGDVALTNIRLSDDREGLITAFTGDAGNDGVLSVGETWLFTKAGTASAAAYSNVGTVTGRATDGFGRTREVTASDGSSYSTVRPAITIDKLTNGSDAPELLRGGAVTWTYTVTNTGTAELRGVAVTDDREGAVTAFTGDVGNDGVLSAGEVWTFRKSGVAAEATYSNTGTVRAAARDASGNSQDVTASDPSSYTTVVPSISIDKLTNGVDGAVLLAGSAVTWTYAVTNTGAIALRGVTVTDDREGAITAFTGDVGNDGVLSVGEVWTFSKSGIASLASYTNTGTVSATARDGFGNTAIVGDSDGSSYTTFTLGTIGDEVFFDRNGNGQRDSGEGLAGVTVRLDIGNNGSIDRITTTDSEGRYSFSGLGAGSYAVIVDGATLPGGGRGWANTTDPDGGANGRSVLSLPASASNLLQDFGYRAFDFGDAPDSYATLLSSNGPRHVLSVGQSAATPSLFLGALVDAEATGTPGAAATGDDLDFSPDDEDGVTFLTPVQAGQTARIEVRVTEAAGVDGRLNAWIDFNRDGDFLDAGERIIADAAVANGAQVFEFAAPTTASAGLSYARFRLSTDAAAQAPGGLALDGEVEDYALTIAAAPVGRLDIEKTTSGSSNRNPVAATFDNEDTASGAGVPVLSIGSDVTWTYHVTNIGTTVFTRAQVAIVDDNGTPGTRADDMSVANGRIAFQRVVTGDGDDLLEAGEVWEYRATGTVQNTTALGGPVTLDLSGKTATSGPLGNSFTVSSGAISAKVTGFSRDSAGAWADAYVGRYGGGMGVTDGSEGSGSGALHTIDNTGRDNYALFRFNQNVVVDSAYLGYVVHDSDLRVWIGTVANAFDTNLKLTDAFLAGLGFTEVNETTLTGARLADFNAGGLAGNVLVIAANTGEKTTEDNFKIEHLKVQAQGPGVYANTATVSAPGAVGDSDMSHYRGVAPLVARLDIEKTTSGSSNQNPHPADFNNEDTPNGPGVPVLVVGSDVTWTYRVTNTGEAAFTRAQIAIVDDNGTRGATADDMSVANGRIAFHRVVTGDGDTLLEAGEVWEYRATGTVEAQPGLSTSVTFDMSGSSPLDGLDGNSRSFSMGGVQMRVTAFARDDAKKDDDDDKGKSGGGGEWSQAYLGAFGGGLGVTDNKEGTGGGNSHTVDNAGGRDNYVLFAFDQNVVVDSAFLGFVVNDSDLRVWIGTAANAFSANIQLSDAFLAGLGFTELNSTTLAGPRWADFNAGNRAGNVLVIAANPDEKSPNDFFKIEKLKVEVPAPGIYANTATVSAPGATGDSDMSHYRTLAARPAIDVEKLVSVDGGKCWFDADTASGPSIKVGGGVQFKFVVNNTGNVALSNIVLSDDMLDLNGAAAGRNFLIPHLAAANAGSSDSFELVVHATAQAGQHTNLATATASFLGTTVTDSDAANYFGAAGPGVRSPGFWTSTKWRDFWDGDASAPSQAGTPGFADGDILFSTYGAGGPRDPVGNVQRQGVLIGDFNKNGRTDAGEQTIFYTVPEALHAMTNQSGSDARFILDRALISTWLNYLAGNPLEAANPTAFDAADAVRQAVTWLRRETPDENGDGAGDGSLTLNAAHWRVASSSADWNSPSGGVQGGNTIKDWLDEYNNTGTVTWAGATTRIALDADLF